MMIIKSLAKGCPLSPEILRSLNTCTTCGLCTENCPARISPPGIIEVAKRELVSLGLMTEVQAELNRNILATGNTFGERLDRLAWLRNRKFLRTKANYVYFSGCLASFRYPEIASKTFEILSRFDVTVLQRELCCGSPLIRTGFDASFLMEHNLREIDRIGADTVITGCAGCYTSLKNSYSRQIEVISISEFLADHLSEMEFRSQNLLATYHDPCHLGRINNVYEKPRQLIQAICDFKEMKANRIDARCCGGGGGVRAGYKDLSLRLAKRRLEDVPPEVDCIITSCPLCLRNLSDASPNKKVMDIAELVALAIEQPNR
jgi:Fe-S oxidoreductase